ncbi:PREDICTED: uncharacterized protein LOC107352511 [Acropora digitifera]|uniref:uncharacterized protein LOC107352511 n=1 Tax=Acropora digitifera TaxID=70779 RepID=UPI00077AF5BA|nr:PREDICTED: uncharacterized protein LOC107352511 [Acropora digitifera]
MEHIRIHTRDAGALFLAVLLWQGISVSVRGTRLSPKNGNSDPKLVSFPCDLLLAALTQPASHHANSPQSCPQHREHSFKYKVVPLHSSRLSHFLLFSFIHYFSSFYPNIFGSKPHLFSMQ